MRVVQGPFKTGFGFVTLLGSAMLPSTGAACSPGSFPSPPPPQAPGEDNTQYELRNRARLNQWRADLEARRMQERRTSQKRYWRTASQVVLVTPTRPFSVAPIYFSDPRAEVTTRSWLKGAARNQTFELTGGYTTCGFSGPIRHLDEKGLLLFAPPGPLRQNTLIGYVHVDDVVDPDILDALRSLRKPRER
jgi:hypothetical protein